MTDQEDNYPKLNIPLLTESNYLSWFLRLKRYFRRKGLLEIIDKFNLSQIPNASQKKKIYEAVDIIIEHLGNKSFDAFVNHSNEANPKAILEAINKRYASQSSNNQGRLWLSLICYQFRGDLNQYINECFKLMNEISVVKLNMPQDIPSYTILAKLPSPFLDTILLNEMMLKSPTAVLKKLREIIHLESS